jgi:hypothetical protein
LVFFYIYITKQCHLSAIEHLRVVVWIDKFREISGLEFFPDEFPSTDLHILVDVGDLLFEDTHVGKRQGRSVENFLSQRLLILILAYQREDCLRRSASSKMKVRDAATSSSCHSFRDLSRISFLLASRGMGKLTANRKAVSERSMLDHWSLSTVICTFAA